MHLEYLALWVNGLLQFRCFLEADILMRPLYYGWEVSGMPATRLFSTWHVVSCTKQNVCAEPALYND